MDFWPEDVYTDFETKLFPGVLKQISQQTHNKKQKLTTHINEQEGNFAYTGQTPDTHQLRWSTKIASYFSNSNFS